MKEGRLVVLLAEDEPDDQVLIAEAFRKVAARYLVKVVENGREAIAYLMGEGKFSSRDQNPYPVFIITDLVMPEMDGFALLEQLKAHPAWCVIPVVVLASSYNPNDMRTSYKLGASAFLHKPSGFQELCSLIASLDVKVDCWRRESHREQRATCSS